MEALFSARELRVDERGAPAIDGLTVDTRGERVIILGAPRTLFDATSGMRRPARGDLKIFGEAAAAALDANRLAGAQLDPPLPPTWSPFAYAEWSARLVGHPRADAQRLALDALTRLRMEGIGTIPFRVAPPNVRRAAVIAGALATSAPVIVFEDPAIGLPDEIGRALGQRVRDAIAQRRWIMFGGRAPLDAPLVSAAEEVVVLDAGRVVAQGDPTDLAQHERMVAVRVAGATDAFAALARERGAEVWGDGAHLTIELTGELRTRDLLEIATESNAVVVEIRPLARAFA